MLTFTGFYSPKITAAVIKRTTPELNLTRSGEGISLVSIALLYITSKICVSYHNNVTIATIYIVTIAMLP